jgi:hypothetical protein
MVRGSTPQAATYVRTISALVLDGASRFVGHIDSALVVCSQMIGVIVRDLVSCAYHETIVVVPFAICFQAYYLSSISFI